MENNSEKYIKLEKEYQESINSQKRYFESEIKLLESKFEYEKEKIRVQYEEKLAAERNGLEAFYNVKSVEDLNNQKNYYETELKSQKEWYEQEIIKRQKEV